MRRRFDEGKVKRLSIILIIVLAVVLGVMILVSKQIDKKQTAELEAIAEEYAERDLAEQAEEEAEAAAAAEAEAEALAAEYAEIEELAEKVGLDESDGTLVYEDADSKTYSFSGSVSLSTLNGGAGLLIIDCVANGSNATMTVAYSGGSTDYDIMTQGCKLYIPVTSDYFGSTLSFSVEGEITVSGLELYAFSEDAEYTEIKSGLWITDDYELIEVEYGTGVNTDKSNACVTDGNYLYTASQSAINIYQLNEDDTQTLVWTVSDVSGTREMEISSDGDYLVVTARSNGVYIIDISEPDGASIINHFDSLEIATGLYIEGDYAFICSRYFGIEIYDLSDPYNPELCSVVRGEREYQNCYVDNGILYIAIFNESRIAAYDVSDPYNPQEMWIISTEGKPYDLVVEDGILYTTIAISDLTQKNSSYPGYGLANGFAIYDVTGDEPEEISTARLDGRFDVGSMDIYDIKVQGDYVYLAHTYNGIYVYDCSDLDAPKRIANITVPIYSYDDEFREVSSTSTKIFPYNREYSFPDTVLDMCLGDGCIYFACMYTGVYCVEYDAAYQQKNNASTEFEATEYQEVTLTASNNAYDITWISDIDPRAVAEYGGLLYIACGEDGVLIYSEDTLDYVDVIEVPGISKDIQIGENGMIYVASDQGLYVYDAADTSEIVTLYDDSVSEVQISDDGEYVLALGSKAYILQLTEINEYWVTLLELDSESVSNVYYRALCSGLVADRYAAVQTSGTVLWWNILTGEVLDTEVLTFLGESYGYTAVGDYCIAIYQGGYVYYDPTDDSVDFTTLTVNTIEGESIYGKVSTIGDDIIAVMKEYNGEIWIVDVSNLDTPQLITKLETSGHPDLAVGDEETIYLPIRNAGVAVLKAK